MIYFDFTIKIAEYMIEHPVISVLLLSIVPVAIIIYELRKTILINKIYNFRKELKKLK